MLATHLKAAIACPAVEAQLLRKNCRTLLEETFCADKNFTAFAQAIQPL